jgi:hypothetical protein
MADVPLKTPIAAVRQVADTALAQLVSQARDVGVVRFKDGEDEFELRIVDDELPSRARDFLTKGGRID